MRSHMNLTNITASSQKASKTWTSTLSTHPVLSDPCYDLLKNDNPFDAIIVSDSIPLPERFKELGIFRVVTLATVIAETIDRIVNNVPLSGVYSAIGHKDSANS